MERPEHSTLGSHLRLAELLSELQARLQAALGTRERVDALLDAGAGAATGPDLEAVLGQITEAAARVADGADPAGGGILVAALAAAGAAAGSAEHRREVERLAVVAERDRIARDLHDLVIQRLFATGMSLQTAIGMMPPGPAADRIRQSVDDLDDTIRAIRSAIFTLHAAVEPDRPRLRAQIMAVADELAGALGFAPSLRLAGPLDTAVSREVADGLLAALREGLANIARHARATAAEVSAEAAGGRLFLVVRDNGAGLAPADGAGVGGAAAGGGEAGGGVSRVADRARSLGGAARLTPAAGGGTRLEWDVPLRHARAGQPA